MVKFRGASGMALSSRISVDADLSPFQAQINDAVQLALVRFGILREKENGKFEAMISAATVKGDAVRADQYAKNEKLIEGFRQKSETTLQLVKGHGKLLLRKLMSESMQTFNVINQVTGWSKNQTYQLISGLISGVIGMISSISLGMSMAIPTYGPVLGPIMIAWNAGNAITAFTLQTFLAVTQAQIAAQRDDIGNIFFGDDF